VVSPLLAEHLDPKGLSEVVALYQQVCATVVRRFDGHVAQYVGDAILVYFGFPTAHEDDAQRAVRTGLGIVEGISQLNARLERERGIRLQVRVGIHTGPVVADDTGLSEHSGEMATIGETPNVAARVQALAPPNSVVVSDVTYRLIAADFECRELGVQAVKGISQPIAIYQVLRARSRGDIGRFSLRLAEDPLTARSMSLLVTALTDLHTRCWLIQAGRFEELARYGITRDPELVREANLLVTSISHHSPLEVKVDISPQALAEAIKTGVETAALTGARRKQAELENRGRELELKIKALEAEQAAAQREQEIELQRRERELAQREKEVEIERNRLELERTRLQLVQQRLELQVQAMETATKLIPLLYPNVSDDARPLLIQTLVPSLLQFSELSSAAEITASTSPAGPALPESGSDQGPGDAPSS
jgi:class 3 adenylate cyclase